MPFNTHSFVFVKYKNKLSVQNTKIHDRKCLLILRTPIAPAEGMHASLKLNNKTETHCTKETHFSSLLQHERDHFEQ